MVNISDYRRSIVFLLLVALLLAAAILARVLATLFFAITVGYVLYPLRRRLVARGIPVRIASGAVTIGASVSVLAAFIPILNVVYRRRADIIGVLQALPDVLTITIGEFSYPVETMVLETTVRNGLTRFAVELARSAPTLAMKAVLFVTVVYALLIAPGVWQRVMTKITPAKLHGVVHALHVRIRTTLYAIYGLQTMMGAIAFVVAFVLFVALGYEQAFVLAVLAGLLQFLPVIGPMILIGIVGGYELAVGDVNQGIAVVVFGVLIFWIGLDTVVRPQLARRTAQLPGSLYLTGFIGGLLSLGPMGLVAGPLVVAVVVELVELLAIDVSDQAELSEFDLPE